jgi:hypothetical protein
MRTISILILGALLAAGCRDDRVVSPRTRPAPPQGLHSVTGDHEVFLSWLPNTEHNIAGYNVYVGDCAGGQACPYDPIGSTSGVKSTSFVVQGIANGVTKYYAVSAVTFDGVESELSLDVIFDTPRPEGTGLVLTSYQSDSVHAGYDFSDYAVRSYTSLFTDIFYGSSGGQSLMIAPFADTEIQDAGYASSLDAVDFAPPGGWSPTGTVELITGHCYVVWTGAGTLDDHFAKFRVTSLTSTRVVLDWAYQIDPGNGELRSRPEQTAPRVRRPAAWAVVDH